MFPFFYLCDLCALCGKKVNVPSTPMFPLLLPMSKSQPTPRASRAHISSHARHHNTPRATPNPTVSKTRIKIEKT